MNSSVMFDLLMGYASFLQSIGKAEEAVQHQEQAIKILEEIAEHSDFLDQLTHYLHER